MLKIYVQLKKGVIIMNNRIILCDDSHGSSELASKYVTGQRRTYVGVEIDYNCQKNLSNAIDKWREEISPVVKGVSAFHFTDVLNCRPGTVWENKREWAFATFDAFALLFEKYQIETFVQTIEPYSLKDRANIPKEFMGIKIENNSHIAFLFMIGRILRTRQKGDCIRLLVEESVDTRKAGNVISSSRTDPDLILDFQSKQNNLLQFADFVAFMVNRMNHIEAKGKVTSDIDEKMLEIGRKIAETMNCKTMIYTDIDLNKDLKTQFEAMRILDRDSKNLPLL